MAFQRFSDPGAAAQHFLDEGWRPVPGKGGTMYHPDSFDAERATRLRIASFDSVGRAFTYAAWESPEIHAFIHGCHKALCAAAATDARAA